MRVMRLLSLPLALALALGLATSGSARERAAQRADLGSDLTVAQTSGPPASESKDARVQERENGKREAPRYKPPRVGHAWRTIGGATRGSETCRPVIAVIAPHDHSGLTTREQPTLYWYLSDTCPSSVDFTLMEAEGIAPLVEVSLTSPRNAGLQPLDLAPYGVHLEVGKPYKWSIAFVPDREHRSKDIVAEGGIVRIEPTGDLSSQLAGAPEEDMPLIYAEAGLWYDALSQLSSLIQANPSNQDLREQRVFLLEQVQLVNVAAQDAAQAGANPG